MVRHQTPGEARAAHVTGLLLREFLRRPGQYRKVWEYAARIRNLRIPPDDLSEEAIRRVLVKHDGGNPDDGRLMKDKVNRALRGKTLEPETLELLIAAFGMTPADADHLRTLLAGAEKSRIIVGQLPLKLDIAVAPAEHETVHLIEEHYLGPDGLPARHETTQTIIVTADSMSHYPYRCDTDEIKSLSLVRGGTCRQPTHVQDQVYEYDIDFGRVLCQGDDWCLKYVLEFDYRQPPPAEFRRVAYRRVDSLNLYLQFHPDRIPRQVWWCEWAHFVDGTLPAHEEPVDLNEECSVSHCLTYIERAVVGFRWQWD